MMPEEFVDFSQRFEVGFLAWIINAKPTMGRTDFTITREKIRIEPQEYDPLRLPSTGSKVTLIFANPYYTERCEMGIVKGTLKRDSAGLEIEPLDITWSLAFDLERHPDRIVKRWKGK